MNQEWWLNALWSIVPTIIIGTLFGLILYAAMNADRKVRQIHAEVERDFAANGTDAVAGSDAVAGTSVGSAGAGSRPDASVGGTASDAQTASAHTGEPPATASR